MANVFEQKGVKCMSYKVFVSYATKSLPSVERAIQAISTGGVNAFVAEHSIAPGYKLKEAITRAISSSNLVLFMWDKEAASSDWVKEEIGMAIVLNKKILPIKIKGSPPLPDIIRDVKYLKLDPESTDSWQALRTTVIENVREHWETFMICLVLLIAALILFWCLSK